MAKNYFDRYIWLIGTISRHGHIPFKEISDLWETCSLNDRHSEPLAVEVEPLRCFWPAEDYHQDYLDKNPQGYCHIPLELMKYVRQLKGKP